MIGHRPHEQAAARTPARLDSEVRRSEGEAVADRAPLAIVGVGYVGLPLAVAFGAVRPTVAFDRDPDRVADLAAGVDRTLEVSSDELAAARLLSFTADPADLAAATIFVVAVPTPVDADKTPDLEPLTSACAAIAPLLKRGDLVVFESTVYPGVTQDVCAPILERGSGLAVDVDFTLGYSPERINPGDRTRRLGDIVKITAGSTPDAAEAVDALYREIVPAGTYRAPSIRVAEAAKVIENTQRDLNIALVNELAVLFHRLGIDTHEVLAAAGTKWNFLPFTPGLVGGHCIGVDPYYLTFKANEVGYRPDVILAGRQTNDSMGEHVADRVADALVARDRAVAGARVLVLGLAFKENCPDLRNSGVVPVLRRLAGLGADVTVCDPWVDPDEALRHYGVALVSLDDALARPFDAVVLAVAHREFAGLGPQLRASVGDGVVFDVKGLLPRDLVDDRL
jgi:UDP-N-acetyl-D-galactosamine dehydrogenase